MQVDLMNYYKEIDRREIKKIEDSKSVRSVPFFDAVIDSDDIWFSSNEFNGLFHGNIITGEIEFLSFFDDESLFCDWMHSSIVKIENELYLFPMHADRISVYDLQAKRITTTYTLPLKSKLSDSDTRTRCICTIDRYIYMFCGNLEILRFDIKSRSIENYDVLDNKIKEMGMEKGLCASPQITVIGKTIYAPIFTTNIILVVDTACKQSKIIEMPFKEVFGCYYDGEFIWIDGPGLIAKCDVKMNVLERVEMTGNRNDSDPYFQGIIERDNEVMFFDVVNKGIIIIDKRFNKYRQEVMDIRMQKRSRWNKCVYLLQSSNRYYLDMDDYSLCDIDTRKSVRFVVNFSEYEEKAAKAGLRIETKESLIYEGKYGFCLEDFISHI